MKNFKLRKQFISLVITAVLTAAMLLTFTSCAFVQEFLFGHQHEYAETVVAPTCSEKGYTLHSCKICDKSYSDNFVDEIPHTPVPVEAVEPTYIATGFTAGERCSVCGAIVSGCETVPVKGYDEYVPRKGNSAYGYYDFLNGEKAAEKQKFYINMYTACEAFYSSKEDIKPSEAQFSDGTEVTYYAVDEIDVTNYKLTNDEMTLVWKIFYVENPLYYWLANNTMIITQTVAIGEVSKVFVLMADESYVRYEDRAKYDADILTLGEDCAKLITEDMSGAKKARVIHDFLANKINYAYKTDGKTPEDAIWAHNIIGASSKGKGVCETYAKTYLYLCLKNDVNCMIVTGLGKTATGSEEHAWNYIEIDGAWYGVDVTWDDQTRIITKYMGANAATMSSDHDERNSYYIQLPELSKTALDSDK